MKMKLIHYCSNTIPSLEQREYSQSELSWQAKPNGLWFSVEGSDDWKEWCKAESYRLNTLRFSYQIFLKDEANILYLKTPEEIFSFTKEYCQKTIVFDSDTDTHQLKWEEIKKKYQGIIIAPYQWDCRLVLESSWYYGWDCASGCIWDTSCISQFEFIGEDLETPEKEAERPSLAKVVKKSLIDACSFLIEEDHKKHEYEFCERTIFTGINYLKRKRLKNDDDAIDS